MFDFGPLAAQSDKNILSYFHTTKQASTLTDLKQFPSNFMFVARPGAGKTALLTWLQAHQDSKKITILLHSNKIRFSTAENEATIGDFRLLLGVELNTYLISEAVKNKACKGELLEICNKFLNKNWKNVLGDLFGKVGGVDILGFGLTLNPSERSNYLNEIRKTARLEASLEIIETITKEKAIALIVDDPELIVGEGLLDVTEKNALRLGSFLSVLSDLHSAGVRVTVFLKEHIIQNVRAHYTDFQHYADRLEGITWTPTDLIEMVQLRIKNKLNAKWDDVFEFNPTSMNETILPYLINGPRDLLRLCNLAGKTDKKISSLIIEKGIRALRAEKWTDLKAQYGKQWPNIDVFAKALTTKLVEKFDNNTFPIKDLRAEFELQFSQPGSEIHELRKTASWIDSAKWENPPVEEKLFLVGCLGYIVSNEKFYPWSGRSLDGFRLADSYFVSPLLAGG